MCGFAKYTYIIHPEVVSNFQMNKTLSRISQRYPRESPEQDVVDQHLV